MNGTRKINVLVAHSDPVVAVGLAKILGDQCDLEIACRGSIGASAMEKRVDVVVSDFSNGIAILQDPSCAARGLDGLDPRVMVVGQSTNECDIRFALNAGAHGYVLQSIPIEDLIDGVHCVFRGARYMCNVVARSVADSMTREPLTTREQEVLELLSGGACNKAIARELGIALGTVKAHVKSILNKLGATTRTHAVVVAGERGLVKESARALRFRPAPQGPARVFAPSRSIGRSAVEFA